MTAAQATFCEEALVYILCNRVSEKIANVLYKMEKDEDADAKALHTGQGIFSATGSSDVNNKVLQTMIQTQIQAMLSNKQIAAPATGGGVPFVTKHCDFHGECAHTTAECRVLQKDPNAKPDKYRNRNRSGNYRDRANDNNRDKQLVAAAVQAALTGRAKEEQAPPIDFGGSMNCMLNSYELLQTKNAGQDEVRERDPEHARHLQHGALDLGAYASGDADVGMLKGIIKIQAITLSITRENEVKLYHNDNH
ncbi:hypothetical protein JL720_16469 [Aureococcus anophagefferens]|nr:hypothetical protein JL720_16469 [Aureococcus anophagefferens]